MYKHKRFWNKALMRSVRCLWFQRRTIMCYFGENKLWHNYITCADLQGVGGPPPPPGKFKFNKFTLYLPKIGLGPPPLWNTIIPRPPTPTPGNYFWICAWTLMSEKTFELLDSASNLSVVLQLISTKTL